MVLPDNILYAWMSMTSSAFPPTWRSLLKFLCQVGFEEMSWEIEAYLSGECSDTVNS